MSSNTSENHELTLPTASIFHKIRKERDKRGYTQEYMAYELGITPRAYQNIETGRNKSITLEMIQKIATIFDMDLLSLLKENDGVTQIAGNISGDNNNQLVISDKAKMKYTIETLQIQLQAKDQKIELLQKRISDLEAMNELLKNQK